MYQDLYWKTCNSDRSNDFLYYYFPMFLEAFEMLKKHPLWIWYTPLIGLNYYNMKRSIKKCDTGREKVLKEIDTLFRMSNPFEIGIITSFIHTFSAFLTSFSAPSCKTFKLTEQMKSWLSLSRSTTNIPSNTNLLQL